MSIWQENFERNGGGGGYRRGWYTVMVTVVVDVGVIFVKDIWVCLKSGGVSMGES